MTTLVTGAAGFLGGHVVETLRSKGETVRGLVRKADRGEFLPGLGAEIVAGDVRDSAAIRRAVQGADVVLHCAAATDPHCPDEEVRAVGIEGTRNVLDALRDQGRGRLVLVSGLIVLGGCNLDGATEDFPYRRTGERLADTKIAVEQFALDYHRQHGTEVAILRPGMVYGPRGVHLPRLLDAIRRGKFSFIGSRDHVVPMVYISDFVQAALLAAAAPAAAGRAYNITDGTRTTIGELIDYLADLLHAQRPQKVLPAWLPQMVCRVFEGLRRLHLVKGHGPVSRVTLHFLATSRSVEIARAVRELGYAPKVTYREGMATTVDWINEQEKTQRVPPATTPA
jgi:2-alkyl-3-oxoalkanoate reductase